MLDASVSQDSYTLRAVVPPTCAADTSPNAADELARIWRSRTSPERWALLVCLDADVEAIARAGIMWANPGFTEAEIDRELFRRRYGDQLTLDAYGSSNRR